MQSSAVNEASLYEFASNFKKKNEFSFATFALPI